jgi:hypothetical protein
MNNRMQGDQTKSKQVSRKSVIGLVFAILTLIIGAVTALSMQIGQTAGVNVRAGQARPLTPEEARILSEGMKELVNQSTEGLVEVRYADGTASVNLQGHFQNAAVAKLNADGTISQSCVDNADSAAAFFEIDPQLFGPTAKSAVSAARSRSSSGKLEER